MLSKSQLSFLVAVFAGLLLVSSGALRAARASGSTFATFSTQPGSTLDYFTSGGSGTVASTIPVTFQFLNAANTSGYGTSSISAFLTITSSTSGAATSSGSPLTIDSQPLGTTTFTFTTTGGQLLFKATSSSASLYGLDGQSNATLADTSGSGNIVTYTSPYLTFNSGSVNSYSLALSGLSSQLGTSGGLMNGFKTGGGVGSFSSAPVPEAGTLASFGLLMAGGGLLFLRRSRGR